MTRPQPAVKASEQHRVACQVCEHEAHDIHFLELCDLCKRWVCGRPECLAIWRIEGQKVEQCVCAYCAKVCSTCKEWRYPDETKPCARCKLNVCDDCNENSTDDASFHLCEFCAAETICADCGEYQPEEVIVCQECGDMFCHACRDDFGVCNGCRERQRYEAPHVHRMEDL